jgi:hypothetical protein
VRSNHFLVDFIIWNTLDHFDIPTNIKDRNNFCMLKNRSVLIISINVVVLRLDEENH